MRVIYQRPERGVKDDPPHPRISLPHGVTLGDNVFDNANIKDIHYRPHPAE